MGSRLAKPPHPLLRLPAQKNGTMLKAFISQFLGPSRWVWEPRFPGMQGGRQGRFSIVGGDLCLNPTNPETTTLDP